MREGRQCPGRGSQGGGDGAWTGPPSGVTIPPWGFSVNCPASPTPANAWGWVDLLTAVALDADAARLLVNALGHALALEVGR